MRILHIIESLAKHKGGLPKALSLILDAESYLGYISSVLTIYNNKDSLLDLSIKSDRIYSFKASFPARFHNSNTAINWLADHVNEFDLVIIHSTWYLLGFRAALLLKKNSSKYVFWSHGSLEASDLTKKKYFKLLIGNLLLYKLLDGSRGVICTSKQEVKESARYGSTTPSFILPFGFKMINLLPLSRSNFRNDNGFDENTFVFLFLSRIHQKKQIEFILHGIRYLTTKGLDVRLIIAGSAENLEYEKQIRRLVEDLEINKYVVFTGWIDHDKKFEAILGSDCFVLPSLVENFGIVVIESLLLGTPVSISNRVYIHNEISSLEAGWVCDPTKKDTIDMMEALVTDTQDYKAKKSATSRAAQVYGLANVSPFYKEQYELIIQNI